MCSLLTLDWEMFLITCLDDKFELVMEETAEINRHFF